MLTASENVEVPQAEAGVPRADRRQRTAELLDYVGLAHRGHHRPAQLSGGEAQRVAIARALANRPRLLLADEPTGELDRATGEQIAALLDRVQADGTAVVVVTHDAAIASRAGRTLLMRDGRIEACSMIGTMAWKSLVAHPVRTAVLSIGFGLGVGVMATLLGVGEVVLEQARAPALAGGGDVVVTGISGSVTSARFVLDALQKGVGSRVPRRPGRTSRPLVAASPRRRADLFLVRPEGIVPVRAKGGIPSLERALGNPETAGVEAWLDTPADAAWIVAGSRRHAACHGPVSPRARRARAGGLVGRVAVLQGPVRRRAVLRHLSCRPAAARRPARCGRAPPTRSRRARDDALRKRRD